MSESWANKYRPTNIDEIVGQERVINELKTLNKNGKLPQAILLNGDSGIGKTTLAYIISKLGKCTNIQEDGSSCNECSECKKMNQLILTGKAPLDLGVNFYNVSKLNRSVDSEEIVEQMSRQNSLLNNKRFFILDEVQVATELGQSRYLNVTEEKPKGMYVIMTTTNDEKLIDPLKSRFIKYKLIKPKIRDIVDRLVYICQEEGVNYQVSGLNIIVKNTGRNLRTAINKLEELSTHGDISKKNVMEHFESISEKVYYDFISAVQTNNLSSVSRIYSILEDGNLSFNHFVKSLGEFIVDLIDISNLLYPEMYTQEEIRRHKDYVEQFSKYQLMGLIRIINNYYAIHSEDKFVFYSFSTELMSLFNESNETTVETIETPVVQTTITETVVSEQEKKYKEITDNIKKDEEETVDKEMSTLDIAEMFGNRVEI